LIDECGHCWVENFEVGHLDYGSIVFQGKLDVAGINLDEVVVFSLKEVLLYPAQSTEIDRDRCPLAPTNHAMRKLNQPALVTLFRVWPQKIGTNEFIRDLDEIAALNYEILLQETCKNSGVEFVAYSPVSGKWVFKIAEKSYAHVDLPREDL
jgi:hypothetical protein